VSGEYCSLDFPRVRDRTLGLMSCALHIGYARNSPTGWVAPFSMKGCAAGVCPVPGNPATFCLRHLQFSPVMCELFFQHAIRGYNQYNAGE
jgi:hypothetical protein